MQRALTESTEKAMSDHLYLVASMVYRMYYWRCRFKRPSGAVSDIVPDTAAVDTLDRSVV